MYLLSQLWLYLVLACLAGAAFGFALRVVCARRAQAAQLQGLRDEARRVDAAHAAELAALRSEHDEALASLRADLTASAAQATALQTRVERLSDDHRQASRRLGLLDAELLTQRADKARLATELQQAAAQATEVGQALDALRADHAALLQASQTERDALQERLAAVQADHATLTSRQTATAGDLSAAQRRAEGLAADLDLARTRAEQLEAERVRLRDVQADEAGAVAQRHELALAALRAEVDAARSARAQQREAGLAAAAAATAAAGAAALAHRQAVEALELRLAERVAERDQRDEALGDVQARLSAAEAELAKREARLTAQAQALDEAARSADALALERDAQRDQLLGALARQQDEAEAARRAHAQALQEQREAHAQAWAEGDARQAEQAERLEALQAALEAAQTDAARRTAELDSLHATLRANDEQLAVLSERAESERGRREALEIALGTARGQAAEQQEACRQHVDALTAELERLRAAVAEAAQADAAQAGAAPPQPDAEPDEPPQPPSAPPPGRPPVSALALASKDELAGLVLAAGDGQAPMGVSPEPLGSEAGGAGHGTPDDLKVIDGIGPVNEAWLHQQGVRYFWQIAAWSAPEVAWVAHHLPNFGSRVYRENWVAQAAKLAAQRDAAKPEAS